MKVDFSNLDKWVNRVYYPLLWDKNRINCIYGGAGSGKSYFQAQRIIYRIIAEPGRNYLIARKVGRMNRLSTFHQILAIINDWNLQELFNINKTEMNIDCINGNGMRFVGLDDPNKIKSVTFSRGPATDIWLEEATELTEADYNQIILRLRGKAKVPFQICLTFNPVSALHWIKRRLTDSPPDKAGKTVLRTTYRDNTRIDGEYVDVLNSLKSVDKEFFEVYANGEWGHLTGLVFQNWEQKKCPYRKQDFDTIVAGQDFGFNHKNAIEIIGIKDGDLYSIGEMYVSGLSNPEIIRYAKENKVIEKTQLMTADSAEPDRIKEWKRAGFKIRPARKGKHSVRYGIDFLKSRKWYVDPDLCPGLVSELSTYKWKEGKEGDLEDEPVPFKDDAIAACRYALEEMWRGKRKARIIDRKKLKI